MGWLFRPVSGAFPLALKGLLLLSLARAPLAAPATSSWRRLTIAPYRIRGCPVLLF